MDDLLTADEQEFITLITLRADNAKANKEAVNRALKKVGTKLTLANYYDLLIIIRDLHQRARITARDERYKWRNLLVDILEEHEFDSAEDLTKYIYEQIAKEE
jgi:hypothetical protein